MCRHLAYLGPPATLGSLLTDPPHSLFRQAWEPRRQRYGTVNADGFGIGWYADGDPVPARYRRGIPIWGDPSLPDLVRVTRSRAVLAAVRSATEGTAPGEQAAAPFADGRWLFSHNGRLDGWPESAAELSAALLPAGPPGAAVLLSLEAMVDSAFLWALIARRLRGGDDMAAALAAAIAAAEAAGATGRFNFLLTDGQAIAATACGDTLWYRRSPSPGEPRTDVPDSAGAHAPVPDASVQVASVTVASEPDDDLAGWTEVPDRHVLTATTSTVSVRPLAPATRGGSPSPGRDARTRSASPRPSPSPGVPPAPSVPPAPGVPPSPVLPAPPPDLPASHGRQAPHGVPASATTSALKGS
jgi:gamma-glutamyl hercynylcysteine S-oxide hydrolase